VFSMLLLIKTLDISQGSVATHLSCGGIFIFSTDCDSEVIL